MSLQSLEAALASHKAALREAHEFKLLHPVSAQNSEFFASHVATTERALIKACLDFAGIDDPTL